MPLLSFWLPDRGESTFTFSFLCSTVHIVLFFLSKYTSVCCEVRKCDVVVTLFNISALLPCGMPACSDHHIMFRSLSVAIAIFFKVTVFYVLYLFSAIGCYGGHVCYFSVIFSGKRLYRGLFESESSVCNWKCLYFLDYTWASLIILFPMYDVQSGKMCKN